MKKLLLAFIIALTSLVAQAQVVSIPDTNFLKALIDYNGVDTNNDGKIEVSEAQAATELNISGTFSLYPVHNLTGIQAFTNLKSFDCSYNPISTVDMSQNTALTYLNCGSDNLDSLNLSHNTALRQLDCSFNTIASLNVSVNTALDTLNAYSNSLTTLNVSSNTALTYLECGENSLSALNLGTISKLNYLGCASNDLTSLNVSHNTALASLYCTQNPFLTQICISSSQVSDSRSANWSKDSFASYVTNCSTITGFADAQLPASQPTLVGVYNQLGQPIDPKQATNGLFIFKYSDGSSKKIMNYE